jgi:hypothetical protein
MGHALLSLSLKGQLSNRQTCRLTDQQILSANCLLDTILGVYLARSDYVFQDHVLPKIHRYYTPLCSTTENTIQTRQE